MENNEEEQERMMNHASITGQTQQNASNAAQYYMQEQEKGIVDVQLEVDSIKTDVYNLIKQNVLTTDENGKVDWVPLKDQKQRILSDWGVDRIMQTIHFYVNKNSLLSNFSEDQINRIMLRFVCELNDLVLLKYQILFKELSFEECKEIILERIKDKKAMRMFTLDILGKKYDEKTINDEFLLELEKTLEMEMSKIKEEQRKEKLRDYGLLMAQLEQMVYATLNRAWKGEERGSIRRHTTISELIGNKPQQQGKGGIFSWGKN